MGGIACAKPRRYVLVSYAGKHEILEGEQSALLGDMAGDKTENIAWNQMLRNLRYQAKMFVLYSVGRR